MLLVESSLISISPTNLPQAGQYRLDPNSCLQVSVVGLEKESTNPSLIGTALIRLFHTVEVSAKLQHNNNMARSIHRVEQP